jgi:CRP/FNR family transcriptional regulator
MTAREELAARFPFFDNLGENAKKTLIEKARKETFSKGETLPFEAKLKFASVKRGGIGVFSVGENGSEIFLFRVQKDENFVLNKLLVYECLSPTEIFYIDEAEAARLIEKSPDAEIFFAKTSLEHVDAALAQFNSVLFFDLDKRLANFLISETTRARSHTLLFTHEQIARFIGTSREVVTRKLSRLSSFGAVELCRGKITVKNKELLKKLVSAPRGTISGPAERFFRP